MSVHSVTASVDTFDWIKIRAANHLTADTLKMGAKNKRKHAQEDVVKKDAKRTRMQEKTKGKIYKFYNCQLLRDHKLVKDNLYVRDGVIINPEKLFFEEKLPPDEQIDCNGAIICPGFIDIQINGAFGVDFSCDVDTIEEGLKIVAKGLLPHGVTSFCPTIISSKEDIYRKIVPKIKKVDGNKEGAGILGAHIEGPFISVEKKGAHPEENLRQFPNGFSDLKDLYGNLDNVAMVTIAPELDRSDEVIKELVKKGISVSLGHTTANLVQGEDAIRAGASCITHLFNAMVSFHHRDPHLIGLLTSKFLTDRQVYYGLISDGVHTHPAAVRMAFRSNPRGFIVVTDAIPAMGLPIGKHHMGSQLVEIQDKKAFIAGTNTLCGSIATIPKCVQNLKKNTDCTTEQALDAATLHPAEVLKITDRKGTMNFDTDADFLMLDDNLNVMATYIAGELVWHQDWHPAASVLNRQMSERVGCEESAIKNNF
ncbi:N-acetylglucosamine-6-phosphate deacetylase-like isoform X1 [Mytilus trossulus]|uniref:N-acetylglucosamine-6-phosphate deacetylase-like isoform X1 n=2 Tax=Mytilus trossulus TaxID=6551 RepID=UPI0030079B02